MVKPQSTEALFKLPPSKQDSLAHVSAILHLFHHRNKNQHRHSIWWRHFCVFRRHLDALVSDLTLLNSTPTTHLARAKKKAQDVATRTRLRKRVEVWNEVLVKRWRRSFSQIVADPRFAVLGVVLLGCLADVCALVGVELAGEGDQEFQGEAIKVEGERRDGIEDDLKFAQTAEDVGEVVARQDEAPLDRSIPGSTNEPASTSEDVVMKDSKQPQATRPPPPSSAKQPKKKRRKGDAIDDLFSKLG